jgi:protoheme IX farnesyltransferase
LLAGFTYIFQAILGGITVLLHLDHTWVAAHMGNSMLLLGAVALLALFAREEAGPGTEPAKARRPLSLRIVVLATLAWTYVAMFTGSAVVGAEADVACPSWPQCAPSHLLPATGPEWVNFGHRLAVGLSDVLMLVVIVLIWRTSRSDRRLLRSAHILSALYVGQVFLGAFTVWLGAPEWLKGAHLALAAATWAALVVLAALVWQQGVWGTNSQSGSRSERARGKATPAAEPSTGALYFRLIKPRVIPLLLVPTVAAMLMAAVQNPGGRPLVPLVLLTMLGGTLATGGAHAINQYWDRDIDARMRRTKRRPVVTGQIPSRNALIFGVALSAAAFVQLWLTVNAVAALLALAGNLFYVFVYTVWLKRTSVQNIVIGGAAGAVPPLVGWAAVTGRVDLPALLFFAIIFFWTPAHFWALALVRQEDYRAAGVPMLPVVRGESYTRKSILLYAVMLLGVSLLPFAMHSLGWVYLAAALSLGMVFVSRATRLARERSTARAWGLFKFSNIYLAVLYLAMVADRLLALSGGIFS